MLTQRFIELGEGYSDVYELCELITSNSHRLHKTFIFSSKTQTGQALSFAVAFKPAKESAFMPIYICREGTKQVDNIKPKRRLLFETAVEQAGSEPIFIDLKNSSEFAETGFIFSICDWYTPS